MPTIAQGVGESVITHGRPDAALAHRRRELLSRYPTWRPRTLAQHLDHATGLDPDRPLVMTEDGELTYGEVRDWSRRLARGLMAAGVEPGDNVALLFANYAELIALRMAVAAVGAVSVPLNYLFRTHELGYVLEQSDAVLLVTMSSFGDLDFLAMLDELAPGWETDPTRRFPKLRRVVTFDPDGASRPGVPTLQQLEESGGTVADAEQRAREADTDPRSVAEIVYTSGTTGAPKGVMLTHDAVLRSAFTSALTRGIGDGHRIYIATPLYHNLADIMGLLCVTFVGGAVVLDQRFDVERAFRAIERLAINEAVLVPTMAIAMVEHPSRDAYDLSSLYAVQSGGAPTPRRVWEQLRSGLGLSQITTAFGQTETGAAACYVYPEDSDEALTGTVGRPVMGGPAGDDVEGEFVEYRVIDPSTKQFLPPGSSGELVIRSPLVMKGYYNKPDETAATFIGEWLRTGDLGSVDDNGYLHLSGRVKELYKSGGELVSPAEVEEFLTGLDGISQAYVVGVADDRWGEVGCAWVVASDADITAERVIALCKGGLARFKVPKHVFITDTTSLPTTATGKIRKVELTRLAAERIGDLQT